MFTERMNVWLDVHARSVATAAITATWGAVPDQADPSHMSTSVAGSRSCPARSRSAPWHRRPPAI